MAALCLQNCAVDGRRPSPGQRPQCCALHALAPCAFFRAQRRRLSRSVTRFGRRARSGRSGSHNQNKIYCLQRPVVYSISTHRALGPWMLVGPDGFTSAAHCGLRKHNKCATLVLCCCDIGTTMLVYRYYAGTLGNRRWDSTDTTWVLHRCFMCTTPVLYSCCGGTGLVPRWNCTGTSLVLCY